MTDLTDTYDVDLDNGPVTDPGQAERYLAAYRWHQSELTEVIPTPPLGTGGRGAGAPDGGRLWWAEPFLAFVARVRDLDALTLPEGPS